MCTKKRRSPKVVRAGKQRKQIHDLTQRMGEMDYIQLQESETQTESSDSDHSDSTTGGALPGVKRPRDRRLVEKTVYVLTTVFVVWLSHALVWAQWSLPFLFITVTPAVILVKTFIYWRNNWQYFMLDFCYWANFLTFVSLWLPENPYLFRTVFAVTNGPILLAAIVWRNSLVYHHHDKITSTIIHTLPPLVTFSIRWFPAETSKYWHQLFLPDMPEFDALWLYVVPFGFFFFHSLFYCLIVNVMVCPKEPYLTSYSYLAVRYNKLNRLQGPVGQGISYYGLNWLFCITSLLLPLLVYDCFVLHCGLLLVVFIAVVWNGASYYVHVFSVRGFRGLN